MTVTIRVNRTQPFGYAGTVTATRMLESPIRFKKISIQPTAANVKW